MVGIRILFQHHWGLLEETVGRGLVPVGVVFVVELFGLRVKPFAQLPLLMVHFIFDGARLKIGELSAAVLFVAVFKGFLLSFA